MIPIRLTLRNFMCYRNNMEPLSFEGFHIACLCGENGSGKSALLDAITWALWGEARAKSDDELVHQGESEMEVEFEFSISGQRYRVIRKHARPQPRRQGKTVLELQIAQGDGFVPITGDNQTKTQRLISDILRIDYHTFINSSFLLQGRADSFTVNDPRERKEVLSRILGLSLYDELEEKAKNMAKTQEIKCQEHASSIKVIDMELVHRPEYEAELARLIPELEQLEGQVATRETAVSTLRKDRETLETKRQQFSETETHIKKTDGELNYWKGQVSSHQTRVERYKALLGRQPEIEAGQHRLAELKQTSQVFDEKFKRLFALQQRRSQLETAIEKARGQLMAEQKVCQARLKEREQKSDLLPHLRGDIEQVHLRLTDLDKVEDAIKSQKEESLKTLTYIHRLESEQVQLASDIKGLKERLALLAQEGARCPLCDSDLGTDGRQRLVVRLQAEAQAKAEAQHIVQINTQQAKQLYQKLEKEAGQAEKRLGEERRIKERNIAGLEKDIAQAEQAAAELPIEKSRLAQFEQRLVQNIFAETEQTALQSLEKEVIALGYDAEEHRRVQAALMEFDHYQLLGQQLEEAKQSIAAEQAALVQAETGVSQSQQILNDMSQRRQTLTAELATLPQIVQQLKEAEAFFQELKGQRQRCLDRQNAVKQSLQHCHELEALKHQKENLLQETAGEQEIYDELAKAFGKKGIQALLIEAALPEVEAEANRLLGRMTDNRMNLKLETQRQTKQGKTVETLDILISDELGTRNYETFSGGEAFRINFALRIALAKLLARRAGAPLPTLVIDEGFGTQDNPGKEKLIEAINSIQDDFKKIIVITHLEELKDVFPVRINVEKTAQGSRVWMS